MQWKYRGRRGKIAQTEELRANSKARVSMDFGTGRNVLKSLYFGLRKILYIFLK